MSIYFSAAGNSKYVAERIAESTEGIALSIENEESGITLKPSECFSIVPPVYFFGDFHANAGLFGKASIDR